jgi:hypothetical protein
VKEVVIARDRELMTIGPWLRTGRAAITVSGVGAARNEWRLAGSDMPLYPDFDPIG